LRFVTFESEGRAEPGVLIDDRVFPIRGAGFDCVVSVIAGGAEALLRVSQWIHGAKSVPLASLQLMAPVPRPPKIICIGLNYRAHAAESGAKIPEVPTVFAKFPTAVNAHQRPIVLPKNSTQPDYEAELALVIGKGGRHIPVEKWRDHVFGYTCFNDVSARDFQRATSQWIMGKTFDTFAPFGPAIVTADEIPDPQALDITLTLNGEVMQNSSTRDMIFPVSTLIAHLSSVFTLEPGDIIATGTPPGVGFARKPPRWLRPGDVAVVKISGVGELINPVTAEQ
jgi:2-keto-4-pentenoate hydratase/2-oxohepta-3-ene-1,7-dioic acid hydratase in catechol pathway